MKCETAEAVSYRPILPPQLRRCYGADKEIIYSVAFTRQVRSRLSAHAPPRKRLNMFVFGDGKGMFLSKAEDRNTYSLGQLKQKHSM